jgi:hypothetical protein
MANETLTLSVVAATADKAAREERIRLLLAESYSNPRGPDRVPDIRRIGWDMSFVPGAVNALLAWREAKKVSRVAFLGTLTRSARPAQGFTYVRCCSAPPASSPHDLAAPGRIVSRRPHLRTVGEGRNAGCHFLIRCAGEGCTG